MTVLTDRYRASKYRAEREAIDTGLRAAAARLPAPAARIAAYHFGWTDAAGEPVEASSGKALRPLLTLLAAEAIAGEEAWRQAVPAAVAVEMIHNFSLIHDDIIDRDSLRRHRPTAWKVYGVNDAILVGDALHALAFEIIAEAGGDRACIGAGLLAQTVRALIEGQLADTRFESRERVDLAECVAMSEAKTASLMGCATALGALFGGGTREQVDALRDFGFRLGLAFQHVDDLLGIWGDPAVTGKAVYSDLRNRKKSLPVTAALGSGHPDAPELAALYSGTGPLTEAQLRRAADLVEACGGRLASRRSAETLTEAATGSLVAGGLRAEAVSELTGLAASTVDRVNLWPARSRRREPQTRWARSRGPLGSVCDPRTGCAGNLDETCDPLMSWAGRLGRACEPRLRKTAGVRRARPAGCCSPRRDRSAPGWSGRSRSSSGSWSGTGRRCTCGTRSSTMRMSWRIWSRGARSS